MKNKLKSQAILKIDKKKYHDSVSLFTKNTVEKLNKILKIDSKIWGILHLEIF